MKNKKIILSSILAFGVLGGVVGLAHGSTGAEAAEMKTIYFLDSNNSFNKTKDWVWTWKDNGSGTAYELTAVSGTKYQKVEIPASNNYIIFVSSGSVGTWSGQIQTGNLLIPSDGKNLYTATSKSVGSWSTYGAEKDVNEIVSSYYNAGTYTKKTQIKLSDKGKEEFGEYFIGNVDLDRTTYFTPNALLMCDYDGNILNEEGHINSGYGTVTEENLETIKEQYPSASVGDMTHFKFVDGKAKYDYIVKNSHKNWDEPTVAGMEGFYITLKDLSTGSYFDSSWKYISGDRFEYTVTDSKNDAYLYDFLAIAAPCLTSSVKNSNYFTIQKLAIDSVGGALKLQIYLNSTNSGLVNNSDCVLAEAIIYQGNVKTIYFVNDWNWSGSDFYAYMWNANGNNSWPGDSMTYHGKYTTMNGEKSVYKLDVDLSIWENVIFTNNNNSQTCDIPLNKTTIVTTNGFMPFYDTKDTYSCLKI